jgi:hypothetical protein
LATRAEHLGPAEPRAQAVEPVGGPGAAFAPHRLAQRRVAAEQVEVAERRRLVEYLVRVETVHAGLLRIDRPSGSKQSVALRYHTGAVKLLICTSSVSYFACIGDNARAGRDRLIGKATRLAESAALGKRKRHALRLRRIKQRVRGLRHCLF